MCKVLDYAITMKWLSYGSFPTYQRVTARRPTFAIFIRPCDEKVGALNRGVNRQKNWELILLSCRGPGVSHLFFTDDLVLFCKTDDERATCVKNVLETFCRFSGHRVNQQKA